MNTRQFEAFLVLGSLFMGDNAASAASRTDTPEPPAQVDKVRQREAESSPSRGGEAKVEGATLSFETRPLAKARRSARGELESLAEARAELQTERPLLSRRSRLEAGVHDVRVESKDQKTWYLVIEPKLKGKAHPAAGGTPAGDPEASDAPGVQAPEAKGASESRDAGGKSAARRRDAGERATGVAATGEGDTGKREAGAVERAASEGGGESAKKKAPKADEPLASAGLRIPLTVAPCEKRSDAVVFEMKSLARGTKLRITIRAGGTQAHATLRFAEKS